MKEGHRLLCPALGKELCIKASLTQVRQHGKVALSQTAKVSSQFSTKARPSSGAAVNSIKLNLWSRLSKLHGPLDVP